ncbi:MAG: polysaccharide deacetylase family protein [Verrucomicrobia bacterium]|nr:polysaccharide deacetylase family protein [Verrucomicrobiota bacterium]
MKERVPVMTRRLLTLLRSLGVRITFFVTGQLAERYKNILQEIQSEGHEIACHTFWHKPLSHYTQIEFEDDLKRNLAALSAAGAQSARGFRAPVLSMTPRTTWAYSILARNGITYSSSVLPGANPLFGWPDFGENPKVMNGVLEIPVSVSHGLGMRLPFASGVYFRALPFTIIKHQFRHFASRGTPIVAYIHLLDLDKDQERFPLPPAIRNPFYSFLMFYNRGGALKRLRTLLAMTNVRISTYGEFHARHIAVDCRRTTA